MHRMGHVRIARLIAGKKILKSIDRSSLVGHYRLMDRADGPPEKEEGMKGTRYRAAPYGAGETKTLPWAAAVDYLRGTAHGGALQPVGRGPTRRVSPGDPPARVQAAEAAVDAADRALDAAYAASVASREARRARDGQAARVNRLIEAERAGGERGRIAARRLPGAQAELDRHIEWAEREVEREKAAEAAIRDAERDLARARERLTAATRSAA